MSRRAPAFLLMLLASPAASAPAALAQLRAAAPDAQLAEPSPERAGTGAVVVRLFDGERRPLPPGTRVLVRLLDGARREIGSGFFRGSRVAFEGLAVRGSLDDDYAVIASADGWEQAGLFPVRVRAGAPRVVDLMLVPRGASFRFQAWEELAADWPALAALLAAGAADQTEARLRYERLTRERAESLAGLLNAAAALRAIALPDGRDGLEYFAELVWDESFARDRFFAYADVELLRQVRLGAERGLFGKEKAPGLFHPGAFTSFKQLEFGEGNLQLTFHHDDQHVDPGDWHAHSAPPRHIKVEVDIDYYKDPLAHLLLEVAPHRLTGGSTDPRTVYRLRWIAGRAAGADFTPPYVLAR